MGMGLPQVCELISLGNLKSKATIKYTSTLPLHVDTVKRIFSLQVLRLHITTYIYQVWIMMKVNRRWDDYQGLVEDVRLCIWIHT